jgi:DNA polymerase-1
MGAGSRKAEIMLVGEAPGQREDESHQAFVGAAGKLLNRLLAEHTSFSRDDCYITNVAKCRPPGNRTPERKEIKVCVENYLLEEVKQVDPKYVLLMGNSALQGFIGKSGITKHTGTRWDLDGMSVMATFHPAAMLRNPKYGEMFVADLQRFDRMIHGKDETPKTRVKIIRTKAQLRWLRSQLRDADEITFDVETNFLPWWDRDARTISIAFTVEPGSAWVVPLWHSSSSWRDNYEKVLHFLQPELERAKSVTHNGSTFDWVWMTRYGIFIKPGFDTMLAAHMVNENRFKSLKHLSQILLQANAYDMDKEKKKSAYDEPIRQVAVYNGKDTDYTKRLKDGLVPELIKDKRSARVFKFLMMPAAEVLVDVQRRGIKVDPDRWTQRIAEATEIKDRIERAMVTRVPALKKESINFNSPDQVAEWLFKDLGLTPLEKTKKGKNSTKESVLLQLAKESKECAALLKWRKWNKYLTTYLRPYADHADENMRIHPSYKLFGTVTGRLSSQNPNLQNVPRNTFIRGLFTAEPGNVLIQADFSQIELRIAAMMAHEKRMIQAFLRGEDLHLKTAAETTGKRPEDIDKETRKKAKAVNFGFLYGMGAPKFVTYAFDNYDVTVTLEEANVVRDRFFESYPALRPWHERQRRLARRYHRVVSPLGRVRHLPDVVSQNKEVRQEAERQAINSPVQSTASDLMLISMLLLHRRGVPVVGTIHDALLFEVAKKKAHATAKLVKNVMEQQSLRYAKRYFGAEIDIPIIADVDIGTHWGEGEPWNG